jgi:uncharacterized membrane protein (UPF0127 family)
MQNIFLKFFVFYSFITISISCLEANPTTNSSSVKIALPSNKIIIAEIADNDKARSRGLMYRKYLPPENGMLFVFDIEDFHSFWMKNTLIPLDIIWLDKDFRIVYFYQNVPPCKSDPCASYAPLLKAKYVLEVNSGFIKNVGLKLDDKLKLIPEP